jgi:hypothetical protein
MQLTASERDEISRIFLAALESNANEDDLATLNGLLQESREARFYFMRLIQLHTSLSWKNGAQETPPIPEPWDSAPSIALPWNAAAPDAAVVTNSPSGSNPLPASSPVILSSERTSSGQIPPEESKRQDSEKRTGISLFSWNAVPYVGSVIVLILFLASLLFWLPRDKTIASLEVKKPEKGLRLVAQILDTCDAQWSEESRPPIGWEFLPEGRWLRLENGFAQISYYCGTQILMEGPSDFCIDAARSGILDQGKIFLRSKSKTNYEFIVNSYNLHVTDLGSEIGLDVSQFGPSQVHVFQGQVRATIDGVNGAPVRNFTIRAGESLLFDRKTQKASLGSADEKRFVQRLPSVDDIPSGSTFTEAIRALRPMAYYPMESSPEDPLAVIDCGPRRRHGRLFLHQPADRPWRSGKIGEALYLRGEKIRDYVLVPDYPQSSSQQLTVLAWVYADTTGPYGDWSMVTANWGQKKTGKFHFGLTDGKAFLGAAVTRSDGIRLVFRDPELFPLHQWQFITLVVDGEMMRLFRNGIEVAAGKADGLLYPSVIKGLGIGCKPSDTSSTPASSYPGFWHGAIDELAIFGRALPPKVIQELYRKGIP